MRFTSFEYIRTCISNRRHPAPADGLRRTNTTDNFTVSVIVALNRS